MNDPESTRPRLTIRLVYEDPPDMIQVEIRVSADGWAGVAWAYVAPDMLAQETSGLLEWLERPRGEFAIKAFEDTGDGGMTLRWRVADKAGHLACHVRISDCPHGTWDEMGRLLNEEILTHPAQADRFARHLRSLANRFVGKVSLEGD